jgi:hypothetical protein
VKIHINLFHIHLYFLTIFLDNLRKYIKNEKFEQLISINKILFNKIPKFMQVLPYEFEKSLSKVTKNVFM